MEPGSLTQITSTRKLAVAFFATSYPQSATDWKSVFVRNLLDALTASGQLELSAWVPRGPIPGDVRYLPSARDERFLANLMAQGGIASILRTGSRADQLRFTCSLLRNLRTAYTSIGERTVIHANWLQTAIPLIGRENPLLVSVLGSDLALLKYPGMPTLLRRVLARRRAIVIPNADWMVLPLREYLGSNTPIETIRFGVDCRWYGVTRTPTKNRCTNWLAVSRLTSAKLGPLFGWLEDSVRKGHRIDLIGPNQENVTIPSWVRYHGPTDANSLHKRWFPEASGLISLSSHSEGLPQVLLEAMAAGLPIIASNIPAHREVVEHGVNGFLVRTEDDFTTALEVLSDSDTNYWMGENARQLIRDRFGTWDDCAARYISAYEQLAMDDK